MEGLLHFTWNFAEQGKANALARYCSGCGRKTAFTDSGKRRRNANGRIIHEFAIFKCPGDHTWNRKTAEYKAGEYADRSVEPARLKGVTAAEAPVIDFGRCRAEGISGIEIRIEDAEGAPRLDKLLAQRVRGMSRTRINQCIRDGAVTLDNGPVAPDARLRSGQVIRWTF